MVTLLIGLSVASVLMSGVMPVWKQMATREKEAELVFRGEQYRRAIGLFQRRAGPGALPPSVDALVEQKYLRKKYKDPITNDDFQPILQGQAVAGAATPGAQPTPPQGRGQAQGLQQTTGLRSAGVTPGSATGGLMGVTSKSKEKSIRLYNGRNYYNEWQFVYVPQTPAAGAPGQGAPGVPGAAPDGRGQRGQPQRGQLPSGARGQFPPGPTSGGFSSGSDGRGGARGTPGGPDGRQMPLPPQRRP